jgi:hypothetical protein
MIIKMEKKSFLTKEGVEIIPGEKVLFTGTSRGNSFTKFGIFEGLSNYGYPVVSYPGRKTIKNKTEWKFVDGTKTATLLLGRIWSINHFKDD